MSVPYCMLLNYKRALRRQTQNNESIRKKGLSAMDKCVRETEDEAAELRVLKLQARYFDGALHWLPVSL
jgi:hypothetical protein